MIKLTTQAITQVICSEGRGMSQANSEKSLIPGEENAESAFLYATAT